MTSETTSSSLPLLEQLNGLGWNVIDLTDKKQLPGDTGRENFTEVILQKVLRTQLKVINPWMEDDQVEEVVKQLTASFPSNSLIENNKHVLHMLLENTSVSENRQTGEKSPTVRFVDYKNAANNNFTAVCQFKIRILGTEHHIVPDITLFLNGLPVVVVECKSPKVKDAIPEAIDQLMRYSEQRGAKGEGSQSLFFCNQFVVATCRNECKFGTITTHTEKYFYRWADPYRATVATFVPCRNRGSFSPILVTTPRRANSGPVLGFVGMVVRLRSSVYRHVDLPDRPADRVAVGKERMGRRHRKLRSERCGHPHYCTWQDLTPRNVDLEPIFGLRRMPPTHSNPSRLGIWRQAAVLLLG